MVKVSLKRFPTWPSVIAGLGRTYMAGSRSLIAAIVGRIFLSSRSFLVPKTLASRVSNIAGVIRFLLYRRGGSGGRDWCVCVLRESHRWHRRRVQRRHAAGARDVSGSGPPEDFHDGTTAI